MIFLCYDRCGTCQKAEKWLKENRTVYEKRAIKEEKPSVEELKRWHQLSGLPVRKLFNTSGRLYKEMGLKDRLKDMTEDEMFELLSTDGMLVKRPMLIGEDFVAVGFKEEEWKKYC